MLLDFFPSLKDSKIILFLQKFLYSKLYIALVGLLTLLCHTFALEIPYYYFIVTICLVIPTLFCEDLLPVVAPLSMTYSTVSVWSNNSTKGISLFKGANIFHLSILVGIILVCFITRLIYDLIKKPERRRKPALFLGFAILLPFYLFGGLFSGFWAMDTFLYGLVCFASISICYFLLLYLVDWKKVNKEYLMWVMFIYGLVIAGEVFFMITYNAVCEKAFIAGETTLFTGWGMRNNIAAQIALCITAPYYLAYKAKKIDWLFLLAIPVMMTAALFTNSRGGSLACLVLLVAGLVIYLIIGNKRQRITCSITVSACVAVFLIVFFIKQTEMKSFFFRFFQDYSEVDFSSSRNEKWLKGLTQFTQKPVLGVGFYQLKMDRFVNFSTGFVPSRYHNTIIQFLATSGILGLLAYGFHRFQTIVLAFKKPTVEKTFIFLSIAALLFSSLYDNHFFNLGPGLNYCVALAFIEGINIQNGVEIKWFKNRTKKTA